MLRNPPLRQAANRWRKPLSYTNRNKTAKKMIKEKDPVLYNMGNYAPEKKYFIIVNKKGFLEIREKLPAIQPQVILQEEKKLNKTI